MRAHATRFAQLSLTPLLGSRRTIGNEISLGVTSGLTAASTGFGYTGTVSVGWANMWSLVGTLAAIIHALDPYHPVGTATPNINLDGACFRERRSVQRLILHWVCTRICALLLRL